MRSCREPAGESRPITKLCGRVLVGKASQISRGAPLGLPEHLPPNQSLPTLLLCALTYTSDFTGGLSPTTSFGEGVNLELQLIKTPGCDKSVLAHKPLRWLSNLPDRFTRTPTATHNDCLQSPNRKRHGKFKIFK